MELTEKKLQPNSSQFNTLANLFEDSYFWPFRQHIEIPNVMNTIGDVRGLSVLDFGCGTGVYARMIKEAGASCVIGYDPAQGMLECAREKVRNLGLDIEFITDLNADVYDGKFDIVLAIYVLPYAAGKDELFEMCRQMGKLVKPGGRLITLPMHPNCNPDPNYYEEYGFRITRESENNNCYEDGEKLELHIFYNGKWDAKVSAFYWTPETIRSAIIREGFRSAEQIDFSTSSNQNVSESLKRYVAQPHTYILECIK